MTPIRRLTGFASLDQPPVWPATRRCPQPRRLDASLDTLPGVGATVKRKLAKLGLETVRDLLEHRPRRYEAAAPEVRIAALGGDDEVVIAGEVLMTLVDSGPAAGAIKGGLLRGLAVTSAKRMPLLPDIPTMAEQGVDLQITLWSGLLAPAGTPPAIIQKLQTEVARIVKLPDVRERMLQLGIEPEGSTPEEFARIIATEIPLWMSVAKANNIQPE